MNEIIIFPNDTGGVVFVYPCECGLTIEQIALKDVPEGKPYLIVHDDFVPKDHTFFGAFESDFVAPVITTNLLKAQGITHVKRRAARDKEMAPLDIQATIPAKAQQAEAQRQIIRDKYAAIQIAVDAATTAAGLKAIVDTLII